jgi:hypothetical protein
LVAAGLGRWPAGHWPSNGGVRRFARIERTCGLATRKSAKNIINFPSAFVAHAASYEISVI